MKSFWYDELITIRTAAIGGIGQIFRFYESGKDTTSFLPAMLVHVFQRLPGKPELTLRIPFSLAYLVTCWCLWTFVRRRYPVGFAASAVFFLPQGRSFYYASETRAYAFVLMGTAIAMVCWQAANRNDRFRKLWALGLFLGLAIAVLFHFFAIFLFVPFAVAELYEMRTSGRRWDILCAIVAFPTALVIMLPNIIAAGHTYGKTFWSRPTFGALTETYTDFMLPVARDIGEIILLIVVFRLLWRRRSAKQATLASEDGGFTAAEWLLLAGLGVAPFIAFVGAQALGVFLGRYVLYFHLGMSLLMIGAIAEGLKRRSSAGWALAVLMLALFAIHSRDHFKQAVNEARGGPLMQLPEENYYGIDDFVRDKQLPVVADGPLVLGPLEHYAPPEVRQRIVLLTSHSRALSKPQAVTTELNMEVFGNTLGLPVKDYDQFLTDHKYFYLVINPRWLDYTWLSQYLLNESVTKHDVQLQLVFGTFPLDDQSKRVYLVHFTPTSQGVGMDMNSAR